MSLAQCFARCRAEGRAALIPFLTCGYPDGPQSLELLRRMADAGADIIELGIPFSDPLADGPTIQRSSFRALEGGMTTEGTLEVLRAFRAGHDTPVVLFGYLNPILRYGVDEFARAAIEAGAQPCDHLFLADGDHGCAGAAAAGAGAGSRGRQTAVRGHPGRGGVRDLHPRTGGRRGRGGGRGGGGQRPHRPLRAGRRRGRPRVRRCSQGGDGAGRSGSRRIASLRIQPPDC